MARRTDPPDQAMPVQNGVDRALGGHAKVAIEPAHQELADFAGAQWGFSCLQRTIRLSICPGSWLA
jgi:hypothetical protein